MMPAEYVKPYEKHGKTDAADAEAICEAVRRPTMQFVEIKSEERQAVLAIDRSRDLVARQRTQVVNLIRSILREFGHILPAGIEAVSAFARSHGAEDRLAMPEIADGVLGVKCHQFLGLNARIDGLTKLIEQHAWLDANARRLMRMSGIGPITASAIVATIGGAHQFRTGRDLAAWLGLTPLNKSSGGKERLGRITKKGDRYIRKLLIIGMTSRALIRGTSQKRQISGLPKYWLRSHSGWQQSQWQTNLPGSFWPCRQTERNTGSRSSDRITLPRAARRLM